MTHPINPALLVDVWAENADGVWTCYGAGVPYGDASAVNYGHRQSLYDHTNGKTVRGPGPLGTTSGKTAWKRWRASVAGR